METANLFLPFLNLDKITFLPFEVDILFKKPWVFNLFLFLGL